MDVIQASQKSMNDVLIIISNFSTIYWESHTFVTNSCLSRKTITTHAQNKILNFGWRFDVPN